MTTVLSVPLVREQRPQAGVANMPGPGDALGAQHAFLSGAEPGDRRLAARVAFVDAEFDAADADREGVPQHQPLHAPVEPGTAHVGVDVAAADLDRLRRHIGRSEEHTSELQSLMRNSYAVFCLKKKRKKT